jgi:hypothetical protein
MFTDGGILLDAEPSSVVVVERESARCIADALQNRRIPNVKSNATVTRAATRSEPRQPKRFQEKEKHALIAALVLFPKCWDEVPFRTRGARRADRR